MMTRMRVILPSLSSSLLSDRAPPPSPCSPPSSPVPGRGGRFGPFEHSKAFGDVLR